jgi:hypothetical protein
LFGELHLLKRILNLKTAYKQIKDDRNSISIFLLSKGATENDITFKSIDINKDYKYKTKFNVDGDKVDSVLPDFFFYYVKHNISCIYTFL